MKDQFSRSVLEQIVTYFPPSPGVLSLLGENIDCKAIGFHWVQGQMFFFSIFAVLALNSVLQFIDKTMTMVW